MTSPVQQRKSLRQLRESSGTLFAKNNGPTKITCNTETLSFELEPAGNDDSIRIVPKEALSEPGFQRLWMRRVVTISDDEEMENEITLLMGGAVEINTIKPVQVQDEDGTWREVAPEIRQVEGKNSLTVPVDTDPNSRTFGQPIKRSCLIGGEQIFQTEAQQAEGQPPLCPLHIHESHRVVSTPSADGSWTHQLAAMEAPQKGIL